ncbi:hypothetical protein BDV29DRAFT_184784 [Aspergillus leporis]|uniref:Uncharacterized protein n=1 Tax=Aspergillus leporis TaxID=41062 RepID=A0A5N5WJ26_9EURO|nr:hypothetical protein BDV29DRAFT_184784 [Aspergillus leporis]
MTQRIISAYTHGGACLVFLACLYVQCGEETQPVQLPVYTFPRGDPSSPLKSWHRP